MQARRYFYIILVFIFSPFFVYQLQAQDTTATDTTYFTSPEGSYWADLTGGIGTAGGGSSGIALNLQENYLLLTVLADEQFDDLFSNQSFWEYGATAGIATERQQFAPFFGALSVGVASMGWKRCVENCEYSANNPAAFKTRRGFGIPVQLRLDWRPYRYLGVGILGMADINFIRSFASLNFNVQIGYF
ncbi:MAG TPA: hypothetical protein VE868_05830 [Balneolaceae bacterium]|nr:hypothetical protein [Balneolaceae bacterium]